MQSNEHDLHSILDYIWNNLDNEDIYQEWEWENQEGSETRNHYYRIYITRDYRIVVLRLAGNEYEYGNSGDEFFLFADWKIKKEEKANRIVKGIYLNWDLKYIEDFCVRIRDYIGNI